MDWSRRSALLNNDETPSFQSTSSHSVEEESGFDDPYVVRNEAYAEQQGIQYMPPMDRKRLFGSESDEALMQLQEQFMRSKAPPSAHVIRVQPQRKEQVAELKSSPEQTKLRVRDRVVLSGTHNDLAITGEANAATSGKADELAKIGASKSYVETDSAVQAVKVLEDRALKQEDDIEEWQRAFLNRGEKPAATVIRASRPPRSSESIVNNTNIPPTPLASDVSEVKSEAVSQTSNMRKVSLFKQRQQTQKQSHTAASQVSNLSQTSEIKDSMHAKLSQGPEAKRAVFGPSLPPSHPQAQKQVEKGDTYELASSFTIDENEERARMRKTMGGLGTSQMGMLLLNVPERTRTEGVTTESLISRSAVARRERLAPKTGFPTPEEPSLVSKFVVSSNLSPVVERLSKEEARKLEGQGEEKGKKRSLFALQRVANKQKIQDGSDSSEGSVQAKKSIQKFKQPSPQKPNEVRSSLFSAGAHLLTQDDAQSITKSNDNVISGMSSESIAAAQAEIMSFLSPEIIAILRKQKGGQNDHDTNPCISDEKEGVSFDQAFAEESSSNQSDDEEDKSWAYDQEKKRNHAQTSEAELPEWIRRLDPKQDTVLSHDLIPALGTGLKNIKTADSVSIDPKILEGGGSKNLDRLAWLSEIRPHENKLVGRGEKVPLVVSNNVSSLSELAQKVDLDASDDAYGLGKAKSIKASSQGFNVHGFRPNRSVNELSSVSASLNITVADGGVSERTAISESGITGALSVDWGNWRVDFSGVAFDGQRKLRLKLFNQTKVSSPTEANWHTQETDLEEDEEEEVSHSKGLHHHGAQPGRPGYTLNELLDLMRASVAGQRALAATILTRIITRARARLFLYYVESNTSDGGEWIDYSPLVLGYLFLRCNIVPRARRLLDDAILAVQVAALHLILSLTEPSPGVFTQTTKQFAGQILADPFDIDSRAQFRRMLPLALPFCNVPFSAKGDVETDSKFLSQISHPFDLSLGNVAQVSSAANYDAYSVANRILLESEREEMVDVSLLKLKLKRVDMLLTLEKSQKSQDADEFSDIDDEEGNAGESDHDKLAMGVGGEISELKIERRRLKKALINLVESYNKRTSRRQARSDRRERGDIDDEDDEREVHEEGLGEKLSIEQAATFDVIAAFLPTSLLPRLRFLLQSYAEKTNSLTKAYVSLLQSQRTEKLKSSLPLVEEISASLSLQMVVLRILTSIAMHSPRASVLVFFTPYIPEALSYVCDVTTSATLSSYLGSSKEGDLSQRYRRLQEDYNLDGGITNRDSALVQLLTVWSQTDHSLAWVIGKPFQQWHDVLKRKQESSTDNMGMSILTMMHRYIVSTSALIQGLPTAVGSLDFESSDDESYETSEDNDDPLELVRFEAKVILMRSSPSCIKAASVLRLWRCLMSMSVAVNDFLAYFPALIQIQQILVSTEKIAESRPRLESASINSLRRIFDLALVSSRQLGASLYRLFDMTLSRATFTMLLSAETGSLRAVLDRVTKESPEDGTQSDAWKDASDNSIRSVTMSHVAQIAIDASDFLFRLLNCKGNAKNLAEDSLVSLCSALTHFVASYLALHPSHPQFGFLSNIESLPSIQSSEDLNALVLSFESMRRIAQTLESVIESDQNTNDNQSRFKAIRLLSQFYNTQVSDNIRGNVRGLNLAQHLVPHPNMPFVPEDEFTFMAVADTSGDHLSEADLDLLSGLVRWASASQALSTCGYREKARVLSNLEDKDNTEEAQFSNENIRRLSSVFCEWAESDEVYQFRFRMLEASLQIALSCDSAPKMLSRQTSLLLSQCALALARQSHSLDNRVAIDNVKKTYFMVFASAVTVIPNLLSIGLPAMAYRLLYSVILNDTIVKAISENHEFPYSKLSVTKTFAAVALQCPVDVVGCNSHALLRKLFKGESAWTSTSESQKRNEAMSMNVSLAAATALTEVGLDAVSDTTGTIILSKTHPIAREQDFSFSSNSYIALTLPTLSLASLRLSPISSRGRFGTNLGWMWCDTSNIRQGAAQVQAQISAYWQVLAEEERSLESLLVKRTANNKEHVNNLFLDRKEFMASAPQHGGVFIDHNNRLQELTNLAVLYDQSILSIESMKTTPGSVITDSPQAVLRAHAVRAILEHCAIAPWLDERVSILEGSLKGLLRLLFTNADANILRSSYRQAALDPSLLILWSPSPMKGASHLPESTTGKTSVQSFQVVNSLRARFNSR